MADRRCAVLQLRLCARERLGWRIAETKPLLWYSGFMKILLVLGLAFILLLLLVILMFVSFALL